MQILFFAVCVGKSLKITECEYMYNFCIQTRYIIFINVIAYIYMYMHMHMVLYGIFCTY